MAAWFRLAWSSCCGLRCGEGAAFVCADLELVPQIRDDHAPYIASWLKVLKDDKRAIFTAASHAQKAADFLHGAGLSGEDEEEHRAAA